MKRKKFIKFLMAQGIGRNEAAVYASACSGATSHSKMAALVLTQPVLREFVQVVMPCLRSGVEFRVYLEGGKHAE